MRANSSGDLLCASHAATGLGGVAAAVLICSGEIPAMANDAAAVSGATCARTCTRDTFHSWSFKLDAVRFS